jgi:hypothetical protein
MAGFIRDDAVALVRQFLEIVHSVGEQTGIEVQAAVSGLQAFLLGDSPTSEVIAQYVVTIIRNMHSPEVLHDFTRPAIPNYQTPSRNRQRTNSAAFVQLVQTCAIARSVRITADLQTSPRYSAESTALRDTAALVTRNEMQMLRVKATQLVTDQLIELSDLSLYPSTQAALVALRTNAVRHMTILGEHLARTFGTTCCDGLNWYNYMPALALAYRHYGVLEDDVIIERNEIPNPLFIEPNSYVELLHEVTL